MFTPDHMKRILANPYYCINISPDMCTEHEAMISEEMWIKAALVYIKENWAETFLTNLLANLKWDFVTNDV